MSLLLVSAGGGGFCLWSKTSFPPRKGGMIVLFFRKWLKRQVYTYYKTFGIVDGGNYGDKSMCYSYQLKPCAHHSTSAKYPNCTSSEATPKCARKCVDNGANWRSSKHYGSGGYSVCQQGDSKCSDAMMQEIYQNGPITGMFFVHQSFFSWWFQSVLFETCVFPFHLDPLGVIIRNWLAFWGVWVDTT